jgi:oxaloacetate decarboxylase beta subunit
MFGNLIRECGVLGSLSETAQGAFANIITLLLGFTIAVRLHADAFLQWETIMIMGLGLIAFIFDTAGGVMLGHLFNLLPGKNKVNPMIGAAGISAFPMSSRVVHKMGVKEDPTNILIMHAAGANVSGQIASVIAGGIMLSFFG